LTLPVERIEQSRLDRPRVCRQVVERLAALARNAGRRHIQIASQIKGHRPMQDTACGRDRFAVTGRPDPDQHLVKGVGVGEDVMRSLPVSVLVGIAEARHPKGRAICQRPGEVDWRRASSNGRLERVDDPGRIVVKQGLAERRVARIRASADLPKQLRQLVCCLIA
jgi:hypothetical protein